MGQLENTPDRKVTPDESTEQVEPVPPRKFVPWPPPGLKRAQGLLWPIIILLGLGDLILVLPLLWAIAGSEGTWSLGPFRDWWILALTSGFGLIIILAAVQRMFHLLSLSRKAEMMGHGILTIAQTAIDASNDMGALIQGGRAFAHMDDPVRESLVRYHLVGAFLYLFAALWIPVGFTLSLFLAAQGIASAGAVWYLTLLPAILAVLAALICRVQAGVRTGTVTLRVRRTAEEYLDGTQVEEWKEDFDRHDGAGVLRRGSSSGGRRFHTAMIIVTAATVLTLIPLFILFSGSSTTPLLFPEPSPMGLVEGVAKVEFMRQYRLRPDYSISATQAGEALQSINLVSNGGEPYTPLGREPVRKYSGPWGEVIFRTQNLFERFLQEDLTEGEYEYFIQAARHPALEEFRILGRASEADFVTTRWNMPLPDTLSGIELVHPRMTGVLDGANAQIARAAIQYRAGRHTMSEELIREVISTGFLLIGEDPMLISNLAGTVLVRQGGEALESFYMATGRIDEARSIHISRDNVSRAVEHMVISSAEKQIGYEKMARLVSSETTLRGLRWDYFIRLNMVSPVMSPHKAVFGRDADFEVWKEEVRRSLVRWPGEEELFSLFGENWLLSPADLERGGLLKFAFGLVFGGNDAPGNLVSLIRSY